EKPADVAQAAQTRAFGLVSLKVEADSAAAPDVVGLACRGVDGVRRAQFGTSGDQAVTKPLGCCEGRHVSLASLINFAYDVPLNRISGLPNWGRPNQDGLFISIDATADDETKATADQLREMLQPVLRDRFSLRFQIQTSEVDGYALVVDKNGA